MLMKIGVDKESRELWIGVVKETPLIKKSWFMVDPVMAQAIKRGICFF